MLITENSEVLWGICFVVFLIALYIICLEFLQPLSCLFFFGPPLDQCNAQKTGLLDHGVMVRKATAATAPWYFFQPCKRVVISTSPGLVGDCKKDWSAGASLKQMVGSTWLVHPNKRTVRSDILHRITKQFMFM